MDLQGRERFFQFHAVSGKFWQKKTVSQRGPAYRPICLSGPYHHIIQYYFKIVCWRPLPHRVLEPPPLGNPGSATDKPTKNNDDTLGGGSGIVFGNRTI